jgi:hypothetical protein
MVDFNDKDTHDRPDLSSERAPQTDKTVTLGGGGNSGQMSKIWAWHQDILTDWLTVSRNVTLTLTLTLTYQFITQLPVVSCNTVSSIKCCTRSKWTIINVGGVSHIDTSSHILVTPTWFEQQANFCLRNNNNNNNNNNNHNQFTTDAAAIVTPHIDTSPYMSFTFLE